MNKREKRKLARKNARTVAVKLLDHYLRNGAAYENNEDTELAELETDEIESLIVKLEGGKV